MKLLLSSAGFVLSSMLALSQAAPMATAASGPVDFQNCFIAPLNALDADSASVSAPPFSADCCALLSYGDLSFLSRAWARAGNRTFWPGMHCLNGFVGADPNGQLSREQIQGLYPENPTLAVALLGRLPVEANDNDAASLSFYRAWRGKATLTPLQPALLDLTIVPRAALLDLYLCDASFTAASLEASGDASNTLLPCLLTQTDVDAMARRTLLEGRCPSLPYTPATPWYASATGQTCNETTVSCTNGTLPSNTNASYFDLNCSSPHSGDLRVLSAIKVPCFLLFPASIQSLLSPQYVQLHMERLGTAASPMVRAMNRSVESVQHALCCSSGCGSDSAMCTLLSALNKSSICHGHQCQAMKPPTPIVTDHTDELCPFLDPCTASVEPTTVYLTSSVSATPFGSCGQPTTGWNASNTVPIVSVVNVTTNSSTNCSVMVLNMSHPNSSTPVVSTTAVSTSSSASSACPTTVSVTVASGSSSSKATSSGSNATPSSSSSSACSVSVSTVTVTSPSSSNQATVTHSSCTLANATSSSVSRANVTTTISSTVAHNSTTGGSCNASTTIIMTATPIANTSSPGNLVTVTQCNGSYVVNPTSCPCNTRPTTANLTTVTTSAVPLTKVTETCHVNGSTLYFEYYTNSTTNASQVRSTSVASMDSFLAMCGSAFHTGEAVQTRAQPLSMIFGVLIGAFLFAL